MKKLLLVLTVIFTAFLFSACGKIEEKDITGTYVHAYDDEIEGQNIHVEDRITLRNDNVCIIEFQDRIPGTWDTDGTITINGEKSYFSIKGDKLLYQMDEDGEPIEFIKGEPKPWKIEPLYTEIDVNNPEDGIYRVDFTKDDLIKDGNDVSLKCKIFTEDIYDAIDVNSAMDGDILVLGGREEKLDKIIWSPSHNEWTSWVDSWDDWIWALSPNGGGTYYYHGPDDHHSYTERATITLPISNNCVFTDTSELDNTEDGEVRFKEKKIESKDIASFIENDEYQNFICLNTNIRIEDGKIVEMNRWYIP